MNGPGDNPISACYSCHRTAECKPVSPMTPPAGAAPDVVAKRFQNLKGLEPFDQGSQSLDTSLQLQISLVILERKPRKPDRLGNARPEGPDPQQ